MFNRGYLDGILEVFHLLFLLRGRNIVFFLYLKHIFKNIGLGLNTI
jgi:hypothetical protein